MNKKKVLIAMSGGVDSSIAAYLLKEQGYEVIGITMKLYSHSGEGSEGKCCSLQDFMDAAEIARRIGVKHYIVNYTEDFQKRVIEPFVETYIKGLTPSPCILCNALIKFSKLRKFAHSIGAEFIATGHYSKVFHDSITNRWILCKGKDLKKDQSYFLFELNQEQLSKTLFPLGSLTKDEVKKKARNLSFPVAQKSESQEICFVNKKNYYSFIEEHLANEGRFDTNRPGDITLKDGTVIGKHKGIHKFTIGQRRGLGVAMGKPLYVIGLDPCHNRVIIGEKSDTFSKRFYITRCNWIAFNTLDETIEASCKIRSNFKEAPAQIEPYINDQAIITFKDPQPAITPGQAAVFYWDNIVVGGGWIYKVDLNYE